MTHFHFSDYNISIQEHGQKPGGVEGLREIFIWGGGGGGISFCQISLQMSECQN
jgi:hypothetical protein